MSKRLIATFVFLFVFLLIGASGIAEWQRTPERSAPVAPSTPRLSLGEHSAEINGLNFHYLVAGHGPLLVVQAPAWGIGSAYLQNGLKPLEARFTLLFYDPRGNGESSRPAEQTQMSTSEMVDDLEQLRLYWGLESLDLLGHSQGGSIALGYAARYPTHVRKLALVESSLAGFDSSAAFKKFLEARHDDPRYKTAVARLKDSFATDEEFTRYFDDVLPFYLYNPAKSMPKLLKSIPNTFSVWAYFGLRNSNNLHPLKQETELAQVKATTVILGGSEDPFAPAVVSERIHAGIAQSEMVVLEDSGQFPWIEQPTKFFDCVNHFFEE